MPIRRSIRLVLPFALVLAACGGEATPCVSPPPSATPTMPREGDWKAWSHAQKLAYMKDVVTPAEAPWFKLYEPTKFAELTCRSCHGAGADDGSYKMPNPALPKLAPGHIHELEKTNPKAFAFMNEIVMPRTAQLLGKYPWAHMTMSGFGCFGCHPIDPTDTPPTAALSAGCPRGEVCAR